MRAKVLFLLIAAILLIILSLPIFFYYKSEAEEREIAIKKCIDACTEAMISGIDLTNGPCLLDPIPDLRDWVCDVAHNPRHKEIDDLPENQCSSFGREAKHFVEVDITCKFIRAH